MINKLTLAETFAIPQVIPLSIYKYYKQAASGLSSVIYK